ncbi:MAG: THUMP domain-containing protein [Chloroflexi bacterium]|nr:THUMP domain-containing protein [Chloroflexota bacterium]
MSTYFAVTSPGLEQLAAQELKRLEFTPSIEPGGVLFTSDDVGLYRANLQLRTANRILARVGQFFYATAFSVFRTWATC